MNTVNQNARAGGSGAGKDSGQKNQSQAPGPGNGKDYEGRRNAAACFRNQSKTEDWHPNYQGVMVTEELPAGTRCWVSIYERTSRRDEKYLTVVLKPQRNSREP